MKTELHPCFILHQRPYRETSLLLDVLSSDYGRVDLVARGIRTKNKRNEQALLQPYQKIMLSWSGRGSMGTLNKVESICPVDMLKGSLVMTGFYINELIVRLLHKNEPHIELFEAYEVVLISLRNAENEQSVLRRFEIQLLQALGYGLVLDHDVDNDSPIEQDKDYYYCLDNGPSETPPKHGEYVLLSGKTLLSLQNDQFESEDSLKQARVLMRTMLKSFLGSKPLSSRQLYKSYLNV